MVVGRAGRAFRIPVIPIYIMAGETGLQTRQLPNRYFPLILLFIFIKQNYVAIVTASKESKKQDNENTGTFILCFSVGNDNGRRLITSKTFHSLTTSAIEINEV